MKLAYEYIVGFIDGEGTISLTKNGSGYRPQVLIFNTNREILELIRQTMNLNSPIYEVNRGYDKTKRNKKMFKLQIRSRNDVSKMFNLFRKFPPIVKRIEYERTIRDYNNWLNLE